MRRRDVRLRAPCSRVVHRAAVAALSLALGCANDPPPETPPPAAEIEGQAALLRARRAGIDAARAREGTPSYVDEVELRVSDDYVDEHQVRVTARVPLNRPGEVRARREALAAETEMARRRLDQAALTLEADLCFPAVEAQANRLDLEMYREYAARQEALLLYNQEGQQSGLISEIDASRFELQSRRRLATRQPVSAIPLPDTQAGLPLLLAPEAPLLTDRSSLRQAVRSHHPSVALHRATAARYEALAKRERERSRPWIKFVELRYEHRTGEENNQGVRDPSQNGGGARLSFVVPFGGSRKANAERYAALESEQRIEANAVVDQQVRDALFALSELNDFESRADALSELLALAEQAEAIADRWWSNKLATPSQISGLLDEAFAARSAVLDARERAGLARCTLLAMTGVAAEAWPRRGPLLERDPSPSSP